MWYSFGDGFLLVFAINDKKSFEILNQRRERILKDKHNNFISMVLVGNKQDLSHKREIVMKKQNNQLILGELNIQKHHVKRIIIVKNLLKN